MSTIFAGYQLFNMILFIYGFMYACMYVCMYVLYVCIYLFMSTNIWRVLFNVYLFILFYFIFLIQPWINNALLTDPWKSVS